MNESMGDLSLGIASTVGMFRAEYLTEDELFGWLERPDYWSRLEGRRVCFLVGGRGTGKTTALRALAFEGQAAVRGDSIASWSTIGFYWRIDTSVVTAFHGERIAEAEWRKLFGHFVNLQLTRSVLGFVRWHAATGEPALEVDALQLALACAALGIEETADLAVFERELDLASVRFEARVNSARQVDADLTLSILGRPIGHLLAALRADVRLRDHYFTFAIDEYENLAAYQQRVINTLIKHSGDAEYTFKIGVKEKGVVDRSTLNANEYLSEPADYTTIPVEQALKEQGFANFAARICDDRLAGLGVPVELGVRSLFPELPDDAEAELLGGQKRRGEIRAELVAEAASLDELKLFDAMSLLGACMVGYWAHSTRASLRTVLEQAILKPDQWANRLNNYGFAMLFTIRPRVSGLRKYYSGWNVLVQLADGNIRYLLSLVAEALTRHVVAGNSLTSPVTPQVQTTAAEQIGERAVFELAGLHARGNEIMRLVLGMGRIFGVMASDPYGHTPEVTQFRVDRSQAAESQSLEELISACVMHSALRGFPGDKNSARSGDTKEHDYQLHPIFAAFFAYSYRSKRRISISAADVLALAGPTPQGTVAKLLRRNSRNPSAGLPQQLELLAEFFDDAS